MIRDVERNGADPYENIHCCRFATMVLASNQSASCDATIALGNLRKLSRNHRGMYLQPIDPN